SDCTAATNSLATPQIAFLPALQARAKVLPVLGDKTKVAASDTPIFLDAALQANGAYQALRDLKASTKTSFNKLAVMLIFNRPINASPPDCDATHAHAAQEAAAALASDGIKTYVTVLQGPNGSAPDVAEARAIAMGGGTTDVFNENVDDLAGAKAF